jgi:hypothetical protein
MAGAKQAPLKSDHRRQSVVARDALPLSQRDKTGGNASANILSDVFPQVAV